MTVSETIPNTGVDVKTNWMIVPEKGYTWFTIRSGRPVSVTRKSGRVTVQEVSKTDAKAFQRALDATKQRFRGHANPPNVPVLIQRALKGGRVFFVRARGLGRARLLVRGGGQTILINVAVHARRTVKLTLNRVRHKPRGKGHESHGRHSIAELKKMVRIANEILAPQTNVHLVPTVRDVEYKGDLGDYLEYSTSNRENRREYEALVALRDTAAKINAYAVNGYRNDGVVKTGSTHTRTTHARHIIFNTRPKGYSDTRLGQILAHEVCHALLYPAWPAREPHLGKQSERGLMNEGMLLVAKPGAVGHPDLKLGSGRSKTVYEQAAR